MATRGARVAADAAAGREAKRRWWRLPLVVSTLIVVATLTIVLVLIGDTAGPAGTAGTADTAGSGASTADATAADPAPPAPPPRSVGAPVDRELPADGGAVALGPAFTLVVPPGALPGPRRFSLTAFEGGPPPPGDALARIEITADGADPPRAPLRLELAYRDPALGLPADPSAPALVRGGYLDEARGIWVRLPVTIDAARERVVMRTPHLSRFAFWLQQGYAAVGPHQAPRFYVLYRPADTWPLPDAPLGSDMREFAERVQGWVAEIWHAYARAQFAMPPGELLIVLTNDPAITETAWNPIFGELQIARRQMTSEAVMRHDLAHELFHAIQLASFHFYTAGSQDLTWVTRITGGREWWIEGTPDHAARTYVSGARAIMTPLGAFWFETSLVENGDKPHAYQLAWFLDFLGRRKRVDFKALWDHVATTSEVPRTTLTQVAAHLAERYSIGLDDVWREYVRFTLFDAASAMSDDELEKLTRVRRPARLTDKAPEARMPLALSARYTMKLWRITAVPVKPATRRDVELEVGGALPAGVTVELHVLADDERRDGGSAPRHTLRAGGPSSAIVELGADDALYAVATSTGEATASLDLTARFPAPVPDLVGVWECPGRRAMVWFANPSAGSMMVDGEKLELRCTRAGATLDCEQRRITDIAFKLRASMKAVAGGRLRLVPPDCELSKTTMRYPPWYSPTPLPPSP